MGSTTSAFGFAPTVIGEAGSSVFVDSSMTETVPEALSATKIVFVTGLTATAQG